MINTPSRRYERNSKLSKPEWFARKKELQRRRQMDAMERIKDTCMFCCHYDLTLSETPFCDIDDSVQMGRACEDWKELMLL